MIDRIVEPSLTDPKFPRMDIELTPVTHMLWFLLIPRATDDALKGLGATATGLLSKCKTTCPGAEIDDDYNEK